MKSNYQRLLEKIEATDIGIAKKNSLLALVKRIALEGLPYPTFRKITTLGRKSIRSGNWRKQLSVK